MTHNRSYRAGRSVSEALEELKLEAGKQFDPRVVEVALSIGESRWEELLGNQETGQGD